jgi:integrase
MAYVRKFRDGWRVEVQRHGHRASHVAKTKREAQAWGVKKELELDSLHSTGGHTFGEAAEHYLKTVSTQKESVDWERRRFDAFRSYFGDQMELASITSAEIGTWRDWRLSGDEATGRGAVSGSTVKREINLLRNMFSIARQEWKWITHHPFEGVRLPADNDPRHQLWRWQQIKRVLRSDRGGKTGQVIKAFHIALHTGLRLSEVLSGTFDASRRVFVLARSKGEGTRQVLVPIPRRGLKLLPATFTVDANEASTLFARLTKQLLIEGLTFHDSRATALTLLSRRMDVLTLARISRHKDLSILMNTYYRERAEDISARI